MGVKSYMMDVLAHSVMVYGGKEHILAQKLLNPVLPNHQVKLLDIAMKKLDGKIRIYLNAPQIHLSI